MSISNVLASTAWAKDIVASETQVQISADEENSIMQHLLAQANSDIWEGEGQRTYSAKGSDGNEITLTITVEQIDKDQRAWSLENSDYTYGTFSTGNWTQTIGWTGVLTGTINLTYDFSLAYPVGGTSPLIITGRGARSSVSSSPAGFTSSSYANYAGGSSISQSADSYFTHTNTSNGTTREYRIGLITQSLNATNSNIRFTNDLYIWR